MEQQQYCSIKKKTDTQHTQLFAQIPIVIIKIMKSKIYQDEIRFPNIQLKC